MKWNYWCFWPQYCMQCQPLVLIRGPGLMWWILLWIIPPRSLDQLTSSLARYQRVTDAPHSDKNEQWHCALAHHLVHWHCLTVQAINSVGHYILPSCLHVHDHIDNHPWAHALLVLILWWKRSAGWCSYCDEKGLLAGTHTVMMKVCWLVRIL